LSVSGNLAGANAATTIVDYRFIQSATNYPLQHPNGAPKTPLG